MKCKFKGGGPEVLTPWEENPPGTSLDGRLLAYQKADIALTRQDYDTALGEIERVTSWMAGLSPESELWGMLANLRGLVYLEDPRRRDPALARADFLMASETLQAANDSRGLCMVYNNLFLAGAELGDIEGSLPDLARTAALARAIAALSALETASFTKAWSLTEHLGGYEAAGALYTETYQLAQRTRPREQGNWP